MADMNTTPNIDEWARAAVARLPEKCRQLVADEFERRARALRAGR